MVSLIPNDLSHLTDPLYPDRSDIDYYLNKQLLPSDLRNMRTQSIRELRTKYPFAWVSKDLPKTWVERSSQKPIEITHPLYLFFALPEGWRQGEKEYALPKNYPLHYFIKNVGVKDSRIMILRYPAGEKLGIRDVATMELFSPYGRDLIFTSGAFQLDPDYPPILDQGSDLYEDYLSSYETDSTGYIKLLPGDKSGSRSILKYLLAGYETPTVERLTDFADVDTILRQFYHLLTRRGLEGSVREGEFTTRAAAHQIREAQYKAFQHPKDFNDQMRDYAQSYIWRPETYPDPTTLVTYLEENGIPPSLYPFDLKIEVYHRYRHPYAWLTFIFPLAWIKAHDEVYRSKSWLPQGDEDVTGINIRELNQDLATNWQYSSGSVKRQYRQFMSLLEQVPPLPNRVVLFRGVKMITLPQVGDVITEHGFSSKTPYYYIAKEFGRVLIISYPANHKFYLPEDGHKRSLYFEAMSYPGEQLRVLHTDEDDGGIYCEFIGYAPHPNPEGVSITPPLTDTMGSAKTKIGDIYLSFPEPEKSESYEDHPQDRRDMISYLQELSVYFQLEDKDPYEVNTALNYLLHRWVAPKDLPSHAQRGLVRTLRFADLEGEHKDHPEVAKRLIYLKDVVTSNPRTIFTSGCDTLKCLWDLDARSHTAITWRSHLSQPISWDELLEIDQTLKKLLEYDRHHFISTRRGPQKEPVTTAILLLQNDKNLNKLEPIIVTTLSQSQDPPVTKFIIRLAPDRFAHLLEVHIRPQIEYFPALLNLTGPDSFNSLMAEKAREKRLTLTHNALYEGWTLDRKKLSSEEDIFKEVGMGYVPPNERK
jgi:hypothetical protein